MALFMLNMIKSYQILYRNKKMRDGYNIFSYGVGTMPNKPSPSTVTVSFTLPRVLAGEVDRLARRQMTNKSDLIRRAIMEYLPEEARAAVEAAITAAMAAEDAEGQVTYMVAEEPAASPVPHGTSGKKRVKRG